MVCNKLDRLNLNRLFKKTGYFFERILIILNMIKKIGEGGGESMSTHTIYQIRSQISGG